MTRRSVGAPALIRELRAQVAPPEAVIVGEPTMMRTVSGHKGVVGLNTHVRGHAVHSSRVHAGVPAVMLAARLVTWLAERMERNRLAAAGDADGNGEAGLYDPPYTTLHCGVIEGGTAHNITARDCRFSTDIRYLPEEGVADCLAEFRAEAARLEAEARAIHPEAFIEVFERAHVYACRREPDGAAERLTRALNGDNAAHVASYGSEAGLFQDAGLSTVLCGPGDIAVAHGADEYITAEQLAAGEAFQRRLIERLAA